MPRGPATVVLSGAGPAGGRPFRKIVVPPGADVDETLLQHQISAVLEGLCPACASRLEPCDTDKGPGGRCPPHGRWWASPTDVTWWRESDPRTGEPLQ